MDLTQNTKLNMINNKTALPFKKLFMIWISAGITTIFFLSVWTFLFQKDMASAMRVKEIIYLIQGSVFFLAALWALSMLHVNFKKVFSNINTNIKTNLKLALKYFFIYISISIVAILSIAAIAMLLMKMGFFTMEAFNSFHSNAMSDKLVEKNYFGTLIVSSPLKSLIYLFSACILIPIGEETFFRRLLYVSLRRKMRFIYALFLSSVFFGLIHSGAAFVPALIAGLFLGWIYEKHQNLSVNIMVHGLINFLVILLLVFKG